MLLNLSSFFMLVSISVLGGFFYIKENQQNTELAEKLQMLPVASLSIFVFAFSIGFGPIPWLMMSEIFRDESLISFMVSTTRPTTSPPRTATVEALDAN